MLDRTVRDLRQSAAALEIGVNLKTIDLKAVVVVLDRKQNARLNLGEEKCVRSDLAKKALNVRAICVTFFKVDRALGSSTAMLARGVGCI